MGMDLGIGIVVIAGCGCWGWGGGGAGDGDGKGVEGVCLVDAVGLDERVEQPVLFCDVCDGVKVVEDPVGGLAGQPLGPPRPLEPRRALA